jgi:hypothetical protein
MHIAAPVPQAVRLGIWVQTLPVQHPDPHEVTSHTHAWLTHSWPAPHAVPPPHVQAPDIEHASPLVPHVEHMVPAGAHSVADVWVQMFPTQHPVGHEVALQMHVLPEPPVEQICPDAHAVTPPHVQTPAGEHPSALVVSHGLHVPPPAPHSLVEGVRHCAPSQQPLGQVVPLQLAQLPPLQNGWAPAHELQVPPPEPQYWLVLPPSHWLPLQHPPPHDVLSQTHAPVTQCCPVVHGEPVPQVHCPVVGEQLSDSAPHGAQLSPWRPHSGPVGGETHVGPLQHPFGQVCALQTHAPDWQTCPAPHAADVPHWHTPEDEQLLDDDATQPTHVAPSVPQLLMVDISQVVPLQHPLGHEVELQTHEPPEQTCPLVHAAFAPHWQPSEPQAFALVMSHAEQAAPLVPHVVKDDVSHAAPAQHPVGQFWGVHPVHTCDVQVWGEGQPEQVEPCVPHAAVVVPAMQTFPLQHPLGHELALQTHTPPEQICPLTHAAAPPHVQVPDVLHPSAVAPHVEQLEPWSPHVVVDCVSQTAPEQHPFGHDVASQMHAPPEHRWPMPHAGLDPHLHAPAVQLSDDVELHATHDTPPVPHEAVDDVSQLEPLQQPVGHDDALQTHSPPEHTCPAPHAFALPHLQ